MSWGAFAGGIVQGANIGSEMINRARRAKAIEDEIEIKKGELDLKNRQFGIEEEKSRRDQEKHSWERKERERKEAYQNDLNKLAAGLKPEDGSEFDPVNNPDHQRRLNQFNVGAYRLRVQYGMATPEETKSFFEMQNALRDRNTYNAYIKAATTGDASGLEAALGAEPGSVKVIKDQLGQVHFEHNGARIPGYVVEAAATRTSPAAIRQRDEDADRRGRVADAQIRESDAKIAAAQANAAASNAQRAAITEARQQDVETRREEGQRKIINDAMAVIRRSVADPVTGKPVPDEEYNMAAEALLTSRLASIRGPITNQQALEARSWVVSRLRAEEEQINRAARELFESVRGGEPTTMRRGGGAIDLRARRQRYERAREALNMLGIEDVPRNAGVIARALRRETMRTIASSAGQQ